MAQFLPGKKGKTGLTTTRGRRFKNITGVQVTSWSSIQCFKSLVLLGAKRKRCRRTLHKSRARHRNRKSCRERGIRFGPRRSRLCVMRTGFSNRTTTTTPLALDTRANCTGPFALVARKGHEEFRVLICIYISARIHKSNTNRAKNVPRHRVTTHAAPHRPLRISHAHRGPHP
jgi:hypothetical protein